MNLPSRLQTSTFQCVKQQVRCFICSRVCVCVFDPQGSRSPNRAVILREHGAKELHPQPVLVSDGGRGRQGKTTERQAVKRGRVDGVPRFASLGKGPQSPRRFICSYIFTGSVRLTT